MNPAILDGSSLFAGYALGMFVLMAAASMGLMEKALGPDTGRFPCVNRELIWAMRFYTLVLAARSFLILRRTYDGTFPDVTEDQLITAATMALVHTGLLIQIIRQRLPIGVWRRLQARHARVRKLAKTGGKAAGAVLARAAADLDAPMASPAVVGAFPVPDDVPEEMRPALQALARRHA